MIYNRISYDLQPEGNIFPSVCSVISIRIFLNYLHGETNLSPWR